MHLADSLRFRTLTFFISHLLIRVQISVREKFVKVADLQQPFASRPHRRQLILAALDLAVEGLCRVARQLDRPGDCQYLLRVSSPEFIDHTLEARFIGWL